jgi:PPP family 3-phenylpropionic acid transporter
MKKFWPFSFYFLYFAGIASASPYIVLYYQSIDLSGSQIGLLTGVMPLLTLVSVPFWTGLADRTNRHRLVLSFSMLVGIGALILFPLLETFALVFIIMIIFNIFFAPVSALADSATMYMLGAEKDLYGRVRLGGTIGFGITAVIVGNLVENQGLKIAFWGGAALFFLSLLVSLNLEHGQNSKDEVANRGRVSALLKNPHWLLFMLIAFAGGLALAASNTYFFPYMEELGASESRMGLALTIGTLAEIPVMFFVDRLLRRFKSYGLLIFSMAITGLRLLLIAIWANPTIVVVLQLLNGLTFPVMWVAGVAYADERAPIGLRASAQGLFSAMVMGIGMAVGGFTGGLLLENVGGRGLYFTFGVVVFLILGLVSLIRRRLPPEQISTSTKEVIAN